MRAMTTRRLQVGRFSTVISNPGKTYFPDAELTKLDLIHYYRRASEVMLPHLRNRPVTLQRYPDGIDEDGFFQQHRPDHLPESVGDAELPVRNGGSMTHMVVNGAAALIEVVNTGGITLHTWQSRIDRPEIPDRLVFDLDPSSDGSFHEVRFAARRLRRLLDELELPSFVGTTGSRGVHVLAPIQREHDFDTARDLADRIAGLLSRRHPNRITTEHRKDRRRGRLYVDTQRNAYGQHAVAPYSVRALPGAPVATPLDWNELGRSGMDPQRYHVSNIFRRLGQRDDPWKNAWRQSGSLTEATVKLSGLESEG